LRPCPANGAGQPFELPVVRRGGPGTCALALSRSAELTTKPVEGCKRQGLPKDRQASFPANEVLRPGCNPNSVALSMRGVEGRMAVPCLPCPIRRKGGRRSVPARWLARVILCLTWIPDICIVIYELDPGGADQSGDGGEGHVGRRRGIPVERRAPRGTNVRKHERDQALDSRRRIPIGCHSGRGG
jgi:hypothetical protein